MNYNNNNNRMSGIFRNSAPNSSNNAHNDSTPNKRYSFSAFCTSPGTLKDVTMDNSYGVGYRSPFGSLQQYQGPTSPTTQGRSVREFEEQMATLRKENFNLKLRLYFIEESIPGYQQANQQDGQETLMKQLIDTKVEMEILRKEIQEKQEILKEAAQAMNQMEKIQKDTEAKSEAIVDELRQKIQYLEMERDMDKSQNGKFMNDLLGRTDISENVNALQKIRELEGMVKQSEDKIQDFQAQICKLDDILAKRDETIKEYEEKVKDIVFQNAELLETLENKEAEISTNERNIRGLRVTNVQLKEDNQNLIDALRVTQENFRKEMSNMKTCERQMREQQETLSKMQSTISVKTANTARLLERIQDYEKMVTKMNFERNLVKRENRFFRAIIGKLQRNNSNGGDEYYTFEKEEFYQQIHAELDEKLFETNRNYDLNYHEMKACSDFHGEYKLKQKLCVNINNSGKLLNARSAVAATGAASANIGKERGDIIENSSSYHSCYDNEKDNEPEFPIRYTISDGSLYPGAGNSSANSTSSLHANFSSTSLFADPTHSSSDFFLKCQRLRQELLEHKTELADKACMLQDAEEQLQNRVQIHEKALRTIKRLMSNISTQEEEIKNLKHQNAAAPGNNTNKENLDSDAGLGCLVFANTNGGGASHSFSDSEALHELSAAGQKQKLIIHEQEKTIEKLKAEVKKKTANLQNLVNNELWEKNREIERLTKLVNANLSLSPTGTKCDEEPHAELQKSFSDTEYAKAIERNKLLQRKVDILIQRLGVDRNNEALITKLRNDLHEARSETESAEKWRDQCANLCSMLSTRLEELVGFLNSLLNQKDVLGLLAADRRHAMRKAIDRSLDLSKSLNMSLSISGVSIGNQSLAQLGNLSELLCDVEGANNNQTFNSHEELQSVERLRAENKALKKELDKRRSGDNKKDRRSLPLPLQDNQSESEAWSEPDRKVSLARIGLDEHSSSFSKDLPSKFAADTDSESDALNQSRNSKLRTQERIAQLEQIIAQRDERILKIQCQLVDADNRLKKETLRVLDITHDMEELRMRNEQLHSDLIAIGQDDGRNSMSAADKSLLLHRIDDKTRALEKVQQERDRIAVEARLAEMQINTLREEIDELKSKHETEISAAAAQEQHKLEQLQHNMEELMQQRLSEQERLHKEALLQDWIARTQYDEIVRQLTELQRQFKEALNNIDNLTENEQELKQSLVDSEMSKRALKKQLDESTIQASKTVTERTKALKEKLQLEKHVDELKRMLAAQESERGALQQHVTQLEQEIECITAARLNGSDDASQSGYTSEEVPQRQGGGQNDVKDINVTAAAAVSQYAAVVRAQRVSNSSPDLGIESDAGRVSSVELSNTQRSLLKTVELAASSSKVKEEDISFEDNRCAPSTGSQRSINGTTAATATPFHDCAKVDKENVELRHKLIRTKRALENTYEQLRLGNQRKEQIQKHIKDELLKTHDVLKNARSNMEHDINKKT